MREITDAFKLLDLVGEVLDECAQMMSNNKDDVNWLYLSGEITRIATDAGAKKEEVIDCMLRMSQAPSRKFVGRQIEPILRATQAIPVVEEKKVEPTPVIVKPIKDDVLPYQKATLEYIRTIVYKNYWPNSSAACAELAMLLLKCYNEYNVPVDVTLTTIFQQSAYAEGVKQWRTDLATMLDNFRGYDAETKQ